MTGLLNITYFGKDLLFSILNEKIYYASFQIFLKKYIYALWVSQVMK